MPGQLEPPSPFLLKFTKANFIFPALITTAKCDPDLTPSHQLRSKGDVELVAPAIDPLTILAYSVFVFGRLLELYTATVQFPAGAPESEKVDVCAPDVEPSLLHPDKKVNAIRTNKKAAKIHFPFLIIFLQNIIYNIIKC